MADSSFPVPPTAVGVPVLALMSLILDIPPLAWHIKNRNLAASSLVFWIILSNLMNVVNPFIWPTDDIENWWNGSGLCDVEVKLMIAVTFGVVGSLACIMRSLAQVLDTERTVLNPSSAERHWKMATNLLLCFGGPFYSMVIHYVVQPNRYYIFAISGCTTSYDNSWPKFALILIWPPILCLVAVYYSGRSDHSFILLDSWLTRCSAGHRTNAQIPKSFLGGFGFYTIEYDKVSLLAPFHPINNVDNSCISYAVLCPIQECRAFASIQLGCSPWT